MWWLGLKKQHMEWEGQQGLLPTKLSLIIYIRVHTYICCIDDPHEHEPLHLDISERKRNPQPTQSTWTEMDNLLCDALYWSCPTSIHDSLRLRFLRLLLHPRVNQQLYSVLLSSPFSNWTSLGNFWCLNWNGKLGYFHYKWAFPLFIAMYLLATDIVKLLLCQHALTYLHQNSFSSSSLQRKIKPTASVKWPKCMFQPNITYHQ